MSPTEAQILNALQSEELAWLQSKITLSPKTSGMVWMRCGGRATALFRPTSKAELTSFLKSFPFKESIAVIGAGSNLIVREGGFLGVLISLAGEMGTIQSMPIAPEQQSGKDNPIVRIHCGCGAHDTELAKHCAQNGFSGLEFLCTIPGTIGGNIKMNASCYGSQMSDVLEEIEYVDLNGNDFKVPATSINFQYRNNPLKDSIFISATLKCTRSTPEKVREKMRELQNKREESQPQKCRTSGSSFVNPSGTTAWKLIDEAGLRGKTVGGAMVSQKHTNFIINHNKATATDVEVLGKIIQAEVKQKFGIDLKWEIEFLGKK